MSELSWTYPAQLSLGSFVGIKIDIEKYKFFLGIKVDIEQYKLFLGIKTDIQIVEQYKF